MSRVRSFALGLNALFLVGSGCSASQRNHCDDDANYAGCTEEMLADLALATPRLNKIDGGIIKVRVENAAVGTVVKGKLETIELAFSGVDEQHTSSATVSAAQLSSLNLGSNIIDVTANGKSLKTKIRLFAPPAFDNEATGKVSGTTSTDRASQWLKINSSKIFSVEKNPDLMNTLVYQAYRVSANAQSPALVPDSVPLSLSTGLAPNQIVDFSQASVYRTKASDYSLERRALDGVGTYMTIPPALLAGATALTVEAQGRLALLSNGSATVAVAFASETSPTGTMIPLDSPPAEAKFIATGSLNDDNQPDIIISSGSNTNVWLQQVSGDFKKDTKYALALDGVSALQVFDIDRDNLDDVVVLRAGKIEYLANEGNGTFTKFSLVDTMIQDANVLAVGHVNADNSADIAVTAKSGKNIAVYLNKNK